MTCRSDTFGWGLPAGQRKTYPDKLAVRLAECHGCHAFMFPAASEQKEQQGASLHDEPVGEPSTPFPKSLSHSGRTVICPRNLIQSECAISAGFWPLDLGESRHVNYGATISTDAGADRPGTQ